MVNARGEAPDPDRRGEGQGPHRPERSGVPRRPDPAEERFGWSVLSYLITGMAFYGAVGWLAGRWTHLPVLFPVGMVAGLGFGIALVIFRLRAR